jgi:hypothetical protein
MQAVGNKDLIIVPNIVQAIIKHLDSDKITIPSVELIQEYVESQLIHQ